MDAAEYGPLKAVAGVPTGDFFAEEPGVARRKAEKLTALVLGGEAGQAFETFWLNQGMAEDELGSDEFVARSAAAFGNGAESVWGSVKDQL
jgi:hypothetical protein